MASHSDAVIELRQYTCHPGQRDPLIALFEREFIESQHAVGMRVVGQFRDLDDPDRFVWLRGFPALATRGASLAAFYDGPVWRAHRTAANATMIDSDNVLLLRPVDANDVIPEAPASSEAADGGGVISATVCLLPEPAQHGFVRWFDQYLAPALAPLRARLITEYGKNDFPRLPVREGEHAFVWLSSFASADDHARHRAALEPALVAELARRCTAVQTLRLAPTPRSRLRHDPRVSPARAGAASPGAV